MSLSENIAKLRARIQRALERSPFGNRQLIIMGASKGQSLNKIREIAELGISHMGENYAQELLTKAPISMDLDIQWHFIGRLQSNKIKHILPYVTSIDSVDSVELVQKIGRVRRQLELKRERIPIMIQVNVGQERQKSGLSPDVVENLFPDFLEEGGVEVVGLMCIPPAHKDVKKIRPYFKQMKELFEKLKLLHKNPEHFQYLSMGMSADFEVALEEGSNCIRIGTALFGPRPPK